MMIDPVTAGVGIAVGSSVLQGLSGIMGNKRERKAAERMAKLTFMQRQEENRRTMNQYEDILGYNEAAIYASNLQPTGSPMTALRSLESEFARDMAFRRNAAVLERSAIKAGAPGRMSDIATLAQAGTNIGSALIGLS